MKQLIGLVHLGALTALSVALYGVRRQKYTDTTRNPYPKRTYRPAGSEGELVLLGRDGTVIAREINLASRSVDETTVDLFPASVRG